MLLEQLLMHHGEGGCCGGGHDEQCDTNHEHQEGGCCGSHGEGEGCGNHGHGGCGGHHHKQPQTLTLLMEDDTELTCRILNYVNHNDQTYILLLHPNEKSVMIYRFIKNADGSVFLDDITDEEEFNAVANIYTTYQQQQQTAREAAQQ
jgi:uncharacterized protein YrzB (UPF0473 family)